MLFRSTDTLTNNNTPENVKKFIKQDRIAEIMPEYIHKFSNFVTDTAAKFDNLLHGSSKHINNKIKHINNKIWKL